MNTLKEIISIFVGEYVPITYTDIEGVKHIAEGFSGVDFVWLCGAFLLLIGVYSIFRIIGIVISKF